VLVTDVSGLGKSALCGAVAEAMRVEGEYEFVLWQDAGKLSDVEQFRVVDVDANSEWESLLSHLKLRKCVLVLDNVVDDLPRRVIQESGPHTRVLATSQVSTSHAEEPAP
jgi:hypothetical protein